MLKYNDIDVMLPAQNFLIDFSYTGQKPLDFIDAMILRILNLGACSIEQLATFLNINQLEAVTALNDLISRQEIKQNPQGLFEITSKAKLYFKGAASIPQMELLVDWSSKLSYEMLGLNLVLNFTRSVRNGISINANLEMASTSEKHVQERFQNNFSQLISQNHLGINTTKPYLYKIDQVSKQSDGFHRVKVDLSLDTDKSTLKKTFEDCFSHLPSAYDTIISTVEQQLIHFKVSNLSDVYSTLTRYPLFEQFDFQKFITMQGDVSEHLFHLDGHQFLAPIYAEDNQKILLELLDQVKSANQDTKQDIYWLAPSDAFFGKSENFKNLINRLINSEQFDLKMFLPTSSFKKAWWETKDIVDRTQLEKGKFFAFNEEEAFDGNIELICVRNKFCIVIVHIRYADPKVFTTIPIGEISKNTSVIEECYRIFEQFERNQDEELGPCYGLIKSKTDLVQVG